MKPGEVCKNCGLSCTKTDKTKDGYADPCFGVLPGVKYACCGHGMTGAYIFFENGRVLRFDEGISVSEQQLVNIHHVYNTSTERH